MGVLDKFKKIQLASGRSVPLSKCGKFIIKVYQNGDWKTAEEWISDKPIEMEEIEDLDLFDAVKCDIYSKDGKFIGTYWKYGSVRKKKVKDSVEGIDDFDLFVEKVAAMKDKIDAMKKVFGWEDPLEALIKKKEEIEQFQKVFGIQQPDRKDYPVYAKLLTDREFRQGAKELASDFLRELGKAFAEGVKEGIGMQEKAKKTVEFEPLPTPEPVVNEIVEREVIIDGNERRSEEKSGDVGEQEGEKSREVCERDTEEVSEQYEEG